MEDEEKKMDSSVPPTAEIVEVTPDKDGVFTPTSIQTKPGEKIEEVRRKRKKPSMSSPAEEEFISGFRKGFRVIRKIGEALNFKI